MKKRKLGLYDRDKGIEEFASIDTAILDIYDDISNQWFWVRRYFNKREKIAYEEMHYRDPWEYLDVENQLQATNCAYEQTRVRYRKWRKK